MRAPVFLRTEERQYAPFVALAIFFGVGVGFPLGLTLAVAAAREETLGGRWQALAQVHGHIQLAGWFGLFVLGMGYRLVPRFTGARLQEWWPAPLTLLLFAGGVALRASQPWMDTPAFGVLAVLSGLTELLGAALFALVIWRCLHLGRPEEYGYTPYFAVGAAWLVTASALNLWFVWDAAGEGTRTLSPLRSSAVASAMLFGFITMFVMAVSLRTFPVFFGRSAVKRPASRFVWVVINVGVASLVGGGIWVSHELSEAGRIAYDLGGLAVGCGAIGFVLAIGILRGAPHRLRLSARRSMLFVRVGYSWLFSAGLLQAWYALRALSADRFLAYYETDAVRHLVALGFITTVIFGMSLLVLPRLALRRGTGRTAVLVVSSILALVQGAAVARGAGAVLANETMFQEGFWTMAAGGVFALLALLVFTAYLVQHPGELDVPMAPAPRSARE